MIRTAVLVSILALSACTSGGTGPKPAPAPDRSILSEPIPDHGTFKAFTVDETVDALAFGMAPAIDSTNALRSAMGTGGREVIVPAGDYSIGRLVVPKRTILRLNPGVVLHDSGKLGIIDSLLNLNDDNLLIGYGAKILSDRTDYTQGEFRHGVAIRNAGNVRIEGLESSNHGGDGFYIGSDSRDVELIKVRADNNRRNGLSVTAVIGLYVRDSVFSNSNGTAPEYGIDIEPDSAVDPLMGIVFVRPSTPGNARGGFLIGITDQYKGGAVAQVTIIGHSGGSFRNLSRPEDRIIYR